MFQCRFGSHGDYSIIALSPASVQEMFELTAKAFNLADRYRVPVFVMSDEIVGHMRERIVIPDAVDIVGRRPLQEGALPFKGGPDGIPGFAAFGEGRSLHVTGLTHDERGYPKATSPKVHEDLVMRLVHKVEDARVEIGDYESINPDAEVAFVSYGAPSRTVQQVIRDRKGEGIGHLRLRAVWPFPDHALREFRNVRTFLVPEMNLGQMSREVERHADAEVVSIPKLGGDLHTPSELVKALKEAA
jgi:2-oxoglutarate ferredoxin oxidoreductase subunit alpha